MLGLQEQIKQIKSIVAIFFWAIIPPVGLYFTIKGSNQGNMFWFWVVIWSLALVVAVALLTPRVLEVRKRHKDYPILLKRAATLQEQVDAFNQKNDDTSGALKKARDEGIREGQAQILGEKLASGITPPTVDSIAAFRNSVALVAKAGDPVVPLGARYFVRTDLAGELRGIVEVAAYDENYELAYLQCVEVSTPEFWQVLLDRLLSDSSPPPKTHLEPYRGAAEYVLEPEIRQIAGNIELRPEAQE